MKTLRSRLMYMGERNTASLMNGKAYAHIQRQNSDLQGLNTVNWQIQFRSCIMDHGERNKVNLRMGKQMHTSMDKTVIYRE